MRHLSANVIEQAAHGEKWKQAPENKRYISHLLFKQEGLSVHPFCLQSALIVSILFYNEESSRRRWF